MMICAGRGSAGGLNGQGIKLRSRALVTTLFARLLLSDLFMHGIGAKYDELTDVLVEPSLGSSPHATWCCRQHCCCQFARPPVHADQEHQVQQRLRN